MLATEIDDWLNANTTAGYKAHVAEHLADTRAWLDLLGIAAESELAYFYSRHGAGTVRGWYELNEIDQVQDWTDYAHRELDVATDYVALTGIEGQGIVLYNRITQAVYDVEFGQFGQLADGLLAPIAGSFNGFLQWCKDKSDAA